MVDSERREPSRLAPQQSLPSCFPAFSSPRVTAAREEHLRGVLGHRAAALISFSTSQPCLLLRTRWKSWQKTIPQQKVPKREKQKFSSIVLAFPFIFPSPQKNNNTRTHTHTHPPNQPTKQTNQALQSRGIPFFSPQDQPLERRKPSAFS